ncbi:cupin domain-containing protein [Salsipaludibacter albus]|uniref:cupin domain-containing protein n=1 Tax=Salsipaludibacter albus TaxID=2849650 RepID=UPI001EE49D56|nr:cupin domain-containing protein [Salsipaludibacter albus]MBY5162156.1 cupin domain-containing protein [Salsipaludibacter albus]
MTTLPRPYPPDVYHGEGGEASTWIRPDDTPPDVAYGNGVTCEYLATGDQAEQRFGLYRWTFGEGVSGPDPHFHRSISEQFYVLQGQVEFHDGTGWTTGEAGDFVYVPPGGIHGFRGRDHASMLLLFAPGGPREDYFETLARTEPMDDAERAAFMARHDTWWV